VLGVDHDRRVGVDLASDGAMNAPMQTCERIALNCAAMTPYNGTMPRTRDTASGLRFSLLYVLVLSAILPLLSWAYAALF
jgi:hypothetical protein